jgi:hypothetical protein
MPLNNYRVKSVYRWFGSAIIWFHPSFISPPPKYLPFCSKEQHRCLRLLLVPLLTTVLCATEFSPPNSTSTCHCPRFRLSTPTLTTFPFSASRNCNNHFYFLHFRIVVNNRVWNCVTDCLFVLGILLIRLNGEEFVISLFLLVFWIKTVLLSL